MNRKKLENGTVIAVPARENKYVPAKILFGFKRPADIVLLKLYPVLIDGLSMPNELPEDGVAFLRTGTTFIHNGRWKVLGFVPLSAEEEKASLRTEAGSVMFGDEFVRNATAEDYATFPQITCTTLSGAEVHAMHLVS